MSSEKKGSGKKKAKIDKDGASKGTNTASDEPVCLFNRPGCTKSDEPSLSSQIQQLFTKATSPGSKMAYKLQYEAEGLSPLLASFVNAAGVPILSAQHHLRLPPRRRVYAAAMHSACAFYAGLSESHQEVQQIMIEEGEGKRNSARDLFEGTEVKKKKLAVQRAKRGTMGLISPHFRGPIVSRHGHSRATISFCLRNANHTAGGSSLVERGRLSVSEARRVSPGLSTSQSREC